MSLPNTWTLDNAILSVPCDSVGTTPQAIYIRIPFRCTAVKLTSVLGGVITVANASCAVAVNGGSALWTHTIVQSGSAAGQLDSSTPSSVQYFNEDDIVSITPSGATGTSIPAFFQLIVNQA
jgi:hypothetical protein